VEHTKIMSWMAGNNAYGQCHVKWPADLAATHDYITLWAHKN
jgi:hypothetical protein